MTTYHDDFFVLANQLIEAGRFIDSKGWVPATSGNFSARLASGNIAITVSGTHKGCLQQSDIMLIDADAKSLDGKQPSAEAVLHTSLYNRYPDIKAILHPHSMNATLASRIFKTEVILQDYELLKALPGIDTHEASITVPIFANDQNIPRLAGQVDRYIDQHGAIHAYIIAGHGLYTWGDSVLHALRLLEALDFLLGCELQLHGVKR
jgi:methylthioribulose-1-phosphate dehydratase